MFDILIVYVFCKYIYIYWIYKGVILILFKNSLMKEKKFLRYWMFLYGERELEKW